VLDRGVRLALSIVFAFGRFALAGLFVLLLLFELLLFALALVFLFLGFGLLSLMVVEVFVLRLSVSTGLTVSEASPSFAARLMSMATVCPALTTSPGRGS